MQDELLDQWKKFKEATGDPLTAAILVLAAIATNKAAKQQSLNIQDAATFLGVHRQTVRALVNEGALVPLCIRGAKRFSVEDLQAFQRRKGGSKKKQPC